MAAHKKPALDDIVGQMQEFPKRQVRMLAKACDAQDKQVTHLLRAFRAPDFKLTERVGNTLNACSNSICRLTKSLSEFMEERDAVEMTDQDIQRALSEVARDELKRMPLDVLQKLMAEAGAYDGDPGQLQ